MVAEERCQELREAEDEAHTARVLASLEEYRAGRVQRFTSAAEVLQAMESEGDE